MGVGIRAPQQSGQAAHQRRRAWAGRAPRPGTESSPAWAHNAAACTVQAAGGGAWRSMPEQTNHRGLGMLLAAESD